MKNNILIDDTPVIIDAPVIIDEPVVVIEATQVAQDPVLVKGFIATRNIKIDGVITMKDQLIPEDIKPESLQVLLDSGYVLSVE